MKTSDLTHYLQGLLKPELVKDYCPNGLQVEGKAEIKTIVTGVTACMALIERAQILQADAILVHHGYFWRGEKESITGMKQRRIKQLLLNDMNLFAYHLPLDIHPEFGNNVQLGKELGLILERTAGDNGLLAIGMVPLNMTLQSFATHLHRVLNRSPMVIGDMTKNIRRIAWCTGAAQGYMNQVLNDDVDVFLSGEISEQTVHLARETGVAYVAAGHHATERYGIQALGEHLEQAFGLQHYFVDVENPV